MPSTKKLAHLISGKTLKSVPWKNGGGISREIAIWPKGASFEKQDFAWRLSTAEVNAEGPFSSFPDMERLLTLTSGSEIVLEFPDLRKAVKAGQVLRFNGEVEVSAFLPSGQVSDLGLIYDPDQALTKFTIIDLKARPRSFSLTSPTVFIHCVSGEIATAVFPGENEFTLGRGDTLRISDYPTERVLFLDPGEGEARVVAVEIAEIQTAKN